LKGGQAPHTDPGAYKQKPKKETDDEEVVPYQFVIDFFPFCLWIEPNADSDLGPADRSASHRSSADCRIGQPDPNAIYDRAKQYARVHRCGGFCCGCDRPGL
jgi:hypothetical protein